MTTEHVIQVVDHDVRRQTVLVRCSCGWAHDKPVRYITARRLAACHADSPEAD